MVSSVKLTLKQGVSKGSGLGWECEINMESTETEESMKALIDRAFKCSEYMMKKPLVG